MRKGKHEVLVLVPAYREQLDPLEQCALSSIVQNCPPDTVALLMPEGLSIRDPLCKALPRLEMPQAYFDGISGYNRLMMSEAFYERLSTYEFCLIAQLDVLLLRKGLEAFLSMEADYLGAFEPYPLADDSEEYERNIVWNGGLSLRRVESFRRVLRDHRAEADAWPENEDCFFTWLGRTYPREFRLAPPEECFRFSRDRFWYYSERQADGTVPFGVHAFSRLNPCAARKLFQQHGMDISEQPDLLHACKRQQAKLRVMEAFLREEVGPLFLYGAGTWGKVAARYLRMRGIPVRGFVISDGKAAENPPRVAGLPLLEISRLRNARKKYRILFCFSRKDADGTARARARCLFPKEQEISVFLMDYMMYEAMGDFVLCGGGMKNESWGLNKK